MLNLQDRKWGEFAVKDFFEVTTGTENNMDALKSGKTPLISAKKTDNGLKALVKASKIKKGKVLTWNKDGDGGAGLAYYQPFDFSADSHILVLFPKIKLSRYACIFVSRALSQYYGVFGHGRANSLQRANKTKILLPATTDGTPDWSFMDQYVHERENALLAKYKEYMLDKYVMPVDKISLPLDSLDWREFFIEETATIESGHDIYEGERKNGKTPYIGASSQNNGVCHLINNINATKEAGCISVNRNGSVGYAFYHPYPALYSNDCRKLRLHIPNEYVGLFIATQITAQRIKYNYGYKMGTGRLKRQLILLPSTVDGEPDWNYMERYSKEEQARQVDAYLDYLEKRS